MPNHPHEADDAWDTKSHPSPWNFVVPSVIVHLHRHQPHSQLHVCPEQIITMPRNLFASHAGEGSHMFPDPARNLMVVAIGEFCGTFMFLLLSFVGVQTALLTNDGGDQTLPLGPSGLFYIASSFGAALAVNVWIFFRVTGGMFNPAVRFDVVPCLISTFTV
jgi:hypothetical protein